MGKELFKNIPSKVGDLVKDVRNGRIGLPDLQRPFVWRDNKVRELFDSMWIFCCSIRWISSPCWQSKWTELVSMRPGASRQSEI